MYTRYVERSPEVERLKGSMNCPQHQQQRQHQQQQEQTMDGLAGFRAGGRVIAVGQVANGLLSGRASYATTP